MTRVCVELESAFVNVQRPRQTAGYRVVLEGQRCRSIRLGVPIRATLGGRRGHGKKFHNLRRPLKK
jgi:hypothetical protein